jgi:hypothetical protein
MVVSAYGLTASDQLGSNSDGGPTLIKNRVTDLLHKSEFIFGEFSGVGIDVSYYLCHDLLTASQLRRVAFAHPAIARLVHLVVWPRTTPSERRTHLSPMPPSTVALAATAVRIIGIASALVNVLSATNIY